VEDIHRIIQVRSAKQACSTLLQRGSVGDDLWQRFLRAEQEMEAELRDVVMEVCGHQCDSELEINYLQANSLAPNWGQTIFQTANEIAANTIFRNRLDEIQSQTASEKAWWDKRRASIQEQFMAELDTPTPAPTKIAIGKASSVSSDEPIMVEAGGPAVIDKGSKKKKGNN
jgi:translocation protein SEC66